MGEVRTLRFYAFNTWTTTYESSDGLAAEVLPPRYRVARRSVNSIDDMPYSLVVARGLGVPPLPSPPTCDAIAVRRAEVFDMETGIIELRKAEEQATAEVDKARTLLLRGRSERSTH